MKLLIKDYLASLRERDELDAVVPDLLSELGFHVYSRPTRGTRQYGVDMAAVGTDDDGVRRVFLFSMKASDLTRNDWDSGQPQSLRPSLNEIRDHYIATRIPVEYKELPIVICICFGGDLDEGIQANVHGYIRENSTDRVSYKLWDGDRLAQLILTGILREELLADDARSLFRKSVALLDEPDTAYTYFCRLLTLMLKGAKDDPKALVTAARQISICLWIMFVWARQLNNLEAPYLASERALLRLWAQLAPIMMQKKSKARDALRTATDQILQLHLTIASLLVEKVLPHASKRHGLTAAVRSRESVDANLKLFDLIGRMASLGLWKLNLARLRGAEPGTDELTSEAQPIAAGIASLIENNPITLTPIRDDQAIDISLACLLLGALGMHDEIKRWLFQIVAASHFSLRSNLQYPCTVAEYGELLGHPKKSDEEYRQEVTASSVLYPTIAVWAALLQDDRTTAALRDLVQTSLPHTSMQLWFPGANSEPSLYTNDRSHGAALTGLDLQALDESLLGMVMNEAALSEQFDNLSANRAGLWALVLTACRHHRYPPPPQFWLNFQTSRLAEAPTA